MSTIKRIHSTLPSITIASIGLLASVEAGAADISASFRAGILHTDNLFLAESNEVSDSVLTFGMSLDLSEETKRLTASVRTDIDFLDYQQAFGAEWQGGVAAFANVALIEDRLSWTVEDNFGQRLQDPLSSPNPGNRENYNYFSTGPNIRFDLGERNFLGASGRYSTVSYEESSIDNDRVFGSVQAGRALSTATRLSINVSRSSLDYSGGALFPELDIDEYYASYQFDNARNILNIDAGFASVDLGENTEDGHLIRLQWTRVTSETDRFYLAATSQYTTQEDVFRLSQNQGRPVGDAEDVDRITAPFRYNSLLARYSFNARRTTISIEAEFGEEDYDFTASLLPGGPAAAPDREIVRGRVRIERDLSKSMFAGASLQVRQRDYKYVARNDDDFVVGLTLGYRFSPALNVFVSYLHLNRESSSASEDYTENRSLLGFAYVPAWGR